MKGYKQIGFKQRIQIATLLQVGKSKKEISELLHLHISTIYREIKRNGNKRTYNEYKAQKRCQQRKERLKRPRKFSIQMKHEIVKLILNYQYSPEQIHGIFIKSNKPCVSVVTIYKFIRWDKYCGGNLYKHCRHRLKYIHRNNTLHSNIKIKNRISISKRPYISKEAFGHFEMDTILGQNNKGVILTIVERSNNFAFISCLPYGKSSKHLASVVIDMLLPYKRYIKTITTDNGLEFAEHETISKRLNTQVYFTDPYSSWQKGCIENTNKLIRQYIPKKSNFNDYTQEYIKYIQYKLNNRPRKKLNYDTPKNCFFKNIKSKESIN